MPRTVRGVLLGLAVLAGACAHPNAGSGGNRLLITEEEIQTSNAATAYDVIARLRGEFLRQRGPTSLVLQSRARAVVFLKDQEYGPIETLRDVRSSDLAEIRFFPGPDAVTRFGSQYAGGVIQIVPRSQ